MFVILTVGIFWLSFLISVEIFLVLDIMSNFALYSGHFIILDSGSYLNLLLWNVGKPLNLEFMPWLSFMGCGSKVILVFKVFAVLCSLFYLCASQRSVWSLDSVWPHCSVLKSFAVLILVGFMHRLLQVVPWDFIHWFKTLLYSPHLFHNLSPNSLVRRVRWFSPLLS